MNSDQLQSLIRSILKAVAGAAITKGFGDSSVWEAVTGAAVAIVAFWWSHRVHADDGGSAPNNPQGKEGTLKNVALSVIMAAALALSITTPMFVTGCASANRNAYVGLSATRVTVQGALGLFNVWVGDRKAAGKSTVKEETLVKAAYEKVQNSALVLCDAGRALSAASRETDTSTSTQLGAAFEQAASDFTQDKTDLVNLVYGITGKKL